MRKHLKFIDSLPCVICGRFGSTHHHLLRVGNKYLTAKEGEEAFLIPKVKSKGMGTKSDDRFCLPICPKHHAEAHAAGNDKKYFQERGLEEPEKFALALYKFSGQYEKAIDLMKWHFLGKGRCSELRNLKKSEGDKYLKNSLSRGIK